MEPTQKPVTVVYSVALLSLVVMAAFVLLIIFGHRGHKAAAVADPLIVVAKYEAPRVHAYHRSTMANPQLSQGGSAVLVPTATAGLISGADTAGTYYIYSSTGTKLGSGAETSTTTIAGVTITPTGSTVAAPSGGVIRTYTLAASATATLGTGYKFGVYPASTGAAGYGLFDIITGGGGGGTTARRRPPIFF